MKNKAKQFDHSGSSFDDFLRDESILAEAATIAIKRVIAWQLQQEMQKKRITKKAMATRLRTSRSQLDRLLDPEYPGVTLGALSRAAMVLGKRLKVQIIDSPVARNSPARVALSGKLRKVAEREPYSES